MPAGVWAHLDAEGHDLEHELERENAREEDVEVAEPFDVAWRRVVILERRSTKKGKRSSRASS